MSAPTLWRFLASQLAGVRARSTMAAVLVVTIAFTAGAALLVLLLQHALNNSIRDAAGTRAGEVATQLRSEGVSGLGERLVENNREGQIVQVVNQGGTVVATSTPRVAKAPLSSARPGRGQVLIAEANSLPTTHEQDPYLITTVGAIDHQGVLFTVIVAAPIGAQRESVSTVLSYLFLGLPLLVLLVGAAMWVLVGRALHPVDLIRARVHGIGAAQLADRVPVPATGDEISRLAVTMNQMLDRLQNAQTAQRRFVADASHELRSPLATLTAALDVALGDPTGRTWRDLHEVMEAEADRMRRLVDDLLLLAKADDNRLRLTRSDVDLDDLLDAETRRLRTSTNLRIQADIDPVRVTGDVDRLSQVVRNLADNAVRHANHEIRFVLCREHDNALIIVEDDGDGIRASDRDRVFERFVRLDESRERGHGGSGLGLAIVEEVVRGHGGTVSIGDSSLGGARFEVRLPTSPA
ncbi:MAG: sensor histidine kinase [Dermatophilaceae bacterium]